MLLKKTGIATAALAAAALATVGIVASSSTAVADPTTSPTAGATTSQTSTGTQQQGGRGGQASQDTPVTGDEAAKVSAAVTAKDSAVTVTSVEKDPDGSYDVHGTKDGQNVMFDVSADLQTITQGQAGGGHGGQGGSQDTPVTGDEATKVSAAVTAKDSAVTVTSVRKDPDGSYDVLGTKNGANVMFDVSADLQTVTQAQGR